MTKRKTELEECPTGIPGFDEVTNGGFYRGQLIVLAGNAGAGKTTFSAKFLYEGARKFGEPGLYISTGENKEEFYAYMKNLGMDFEELEKKGLFRYVEMMTPLTPEALSSLSEKLIKEALEINAKRVVIDSITPILMARPSLEVRAILHNALKTLARTLKTTVLITVEVPMGEEKIGAEAEEFVADALIKLKLVIPESGSPYRIMEIVKLRGRPLGRTRYEYEIGPPHGIRILPTGVIEKLESHISYEAKVPTGVEGLDKMLGGGLIKNTTTLIVGPPGSGKTLLCLTIAAANVLQGRRVIFITFEEPEQQIEETLRFLGYNVKELKQKGLRILSINPKILTLLGLYSITDFLIRFGNTKYSLAIFDGVATLKQEFGDNLVRILRDVSFFAKKNNVTLIFSMAISEGEKITGLSTISDNIIELRIKEKDGELIREIGVRKSRMSCPSNIFSEIKLIRGKLVIKMRK